MKDLEKIKKENEQRLKRAMLENKFNEKLEPMGLSLNVVGKSLLQKGKTHAYISTPDILKKMNPSLAGKALRAFPVTEPSSIYVGHDLYAMMDYSIETERCPNDALTRISISWISGDLDLDIQFFIEEPMTDFFRTERRKLSEDEISTYGIQKTRYNKTMREAFPYLIPCAGEMAVFYGGRCRSKCNSWIKDVIEYLKNLED